MTHFKKRSLVRSFPGLLAWICTIAAVVHPLLAQNDDKILRVFIFAGQSNMVGSDSKVKDIERFPRTRRNRMAGSICSPSTTWSVRS
jgi:hypothetical protein